MQAEDVEQSAAVVSAAADTPGLEELLRSAIAGRVEDDGWALLSNVGFQLVANLPTFDSRNYGYTRLGQLVADQDYLEVREVPEPSGNRVLHVRLRDD